MYTSDEVIDFIDKFKQINPVVIEELFTRGYCYWFAKILADRFNGEIYYYPIANHFVTNIENIEYDITGYYHSDEILSYLWSDYYKIDELEYNRIIRDCINKET